MWESCGGGSVKNLDCGDAETKLHAMRDNPAFWKQYSRWQTWAGGHLSSGEPGLGLMESPGVLVADVLPLFLFLLCGLQLLDQTTFPSHPCTEAEFGSTDHQCTALPFP